MDMMEQIRTVQTESHGELTIVYTVLTDENVECGHDGKCYGVRICTSEGEAEEVHCLTSDITAIESLYDLLVDGLVTPTTLKDVVYDWLCG